MKRFYLTEYGDYLAFKALGNELCVSETQAKDLILRLASRVSLTLNLSQPIEIRGSSFRAVDFAGLVRLTPQIEVEIVPKFLSQRSANWREDFFAVASVSRFGHLLPAEALLGGTEPNQDLVDLLGRSFIALFEKAWRRPLWVYKRREWASFNIDGDLEPLDAFMPSESGFTQSGIVLDRRNEFTHVIRAALDILLASVSAGDVRRRLAAYQAMLPHDAGGRNVREPLRKLPPWHRRWKDIYALSKEINRRLGITYKGFRAIGAPGYLIDTSRAWEDFILQMLKLSSQGLTVSKRSYTYGQRLSWAAKQSRYRNMSVTPDVSIMSSSGTLYVADAKYKGRVGQAQKDATISAADIYEALAFLDASGTSRIILVYPQITESNAYASSGNGVSVDRVVVGTREIIGLTIAIDGISKAKQLRQFANLLGRYIAH